MKKDRTKEIEEIVGICAGFRDEILLCIECIHFITAPEETRRLSFWENLDYDLESIERQIKRIRNMQKKIQYQEEKIREIRNEL